MNERIRQHSEQEYTRNNYAAMIEQEVFTVTTRYTKPTPNYSVLYACLGVHVALIFMLTMVSK